MRKIIVLSFVSLDGVLQAPGGQSEDTSGNFAYGGWTFPYFDEFMGQTMGSQMGQPFDLLLGRKTFEIFATYWPKENGGDNLINHATKYVASDTITTHPWGKTTFLKRDVLVDTLKEMKQQDGPDLQVHGSGDLIQTLLHNDLIDEFWLKIFPVTLGSGKRLFSGGTIPAAYTLQTSQVSPLGVIIANYKRAEDIKTGTF